MKQRFYIMPLYRIGKNLDMKLFWDDVVNNHIKEFQLKVHPIERDQIIEIDTVEELKEVRSRVG